MDRIIAGLDLEQKVALLSGRGTWHLEPVPSADLPSITVADGPHGLRRQRRGGAPIGQHDALPATCFPTGVTLGATWDSDLLVEVGAALGRECLAAGVSVLLGPGLNLKRHPRGGRNFEYLSEDPLIAGRLAAALVRGVQSQGVGACLKHLAANHQETFRMVVDTIVDERTLRELELTGFEIAVRGSSPWTVMTAYNRLNGVYCSDHRWLLTDVLRAEWGFDGLVVSDWGGMNDRAAAIAAGCDLEMPASGGAFDAEVVAAVGDGRITEADVDRAVGRVIELIVRARSGATPEAGYDVDEHHRLARRAAAAGTVLLTNDGILPLEATGSIAVIGAFAASPRYQGAGSSQVNPARLDDALTALRDRVGAAVVVTDASGYDPASGTTTTALVDEAIELARSADVAVVFAGLPGSYESEAFDRPHLELPAGHTRLIEALLDVNPHTVVVLNNGGPVELPWAARPAALVEAYLGGQAGGTAIVDVLLGDAEPGGRLAESFPVRAADLPADRHFPGHPKRVEHREGMAVGYRFHDSAGVPARFAFGHGLGYTTFAYGDLEVDGEGTDLTVALTVTNTGDRRGSEVVQLYVRDVEASVPRPDKELRDFVKVHLDPGDSRTVRLHLDRRAFAFYDVGVGDWLVEAGTFELLVGSSSVDIRVGTRVEVDSEDVPGTSVVPVDHAADDEEFVAMLGRPLPGTPPAALPFHRGSPVADLSATALGTAFQRLILAVARRRTAAMAGDDEAARRMLQALVEEAPLRTLVLLGGGTPSFRALDAVIALLNARPLDRVLLRLRGGRD